MGDARGIRRSLGISLEFIRDIRNSIGSYSNLPKTTYQVSKLVLGKSFRGMKREARQNPGTCKLTKGARKGKFQ